MAGNQTILVGDKVPIVLQLTDGAADQFPRALVFDSTHHQLDQIDLTYLGEGLYFIAAGSYSMPDDFFIKVIYIVYTDAAHTIESTIYERDLDVFHRTRPDEFMATGFAVPGEYDGILHGIDVDVSGLNGEAMRGTDSVPTNPLLTNDARLNNLDDTISSRSPAGEYQAALTVIQNEVDGLDGAAMRGTNGVPTNPLLTNDARLNNLDSSISSRSSHGDPTAGIKGAPGKTIQEAFDNERGTNGAYTGTPPTPTEIDTKLTGTHGAGSWQAEGMSEAELHAGLDSYANKDGYKANVSGLAPANEYDAEITRLLEATEIKRGSVVSGATTFAFISDLTETPDQFWLRSALVFTSGQCKGQVRKIHHYTGATKQIQFYTALSYVPVIGDTFVIVPTRNFRLNLDDISLISTDVNTELTSVHGAGSWQEGSGGGSTPAEIDTELTANHGAGSWQAEGMSEAELHSGLTSYAQKDDYKADLSGLSPKNEYALILADILTEVAGLDGNSIPSTADVTAAIFDKIVEGTLTFSDFQRIMFAMLSGTSSGHGIAGPKTYKSEDGLTDRVAFTCDADGNRLSRVITPG